MIPIYTLLYVVVVFICGYALGNHNDLNVTDLISILLVGLSGIIFAHFILAIYTGDIAFVIFLVLTTIVLKTGSVFGRKSQPTETK